MYAFGDGRGWLHEQHCTPKFHAEMWHPFPHVMCIHKHGFLISRHNPRTRNFRVWWRGRWGTSTSRTTSTRLSGESCRTRRGKGKGKSEGAVPEEAYNERDRRRERSRQTDTQAGTCLCGRRRRMRVHACLPRGRGCEPLPPHSSPFLHTSSCPF